ncbi:MAG: DUF5681 domain-containing protein [Chitinophagaceae bacterium]
MAFKAGRSGNPAGKPKGTKNKSTKELKSLVTEFIGENWHKIQEDFKSKRLHPRDRLAFMERLLKFAVPIMGSTRGTLDIRADLEKLSDEQLDQVIRRLTAKTDDDE